MNRDIDVLRKQYELYMEFCARCVSGEDAFYEKECDMNTFNKNDYGCSSDEVPDNGPAITIDELKERLKNLKAGEILSVRAAELEMGECERTEPYITKNEAAEYNESDTDDNNTGEERHG